MIENNITIGNLPALKKLYAEAVKSNKETLLHEGHEFLVVYAKYLIEYMESKYKRRPR